LGVALVRLATVEYYGCLASVAVEIHTVDFQVATNHAQQVNSIEWGFAPAGCW
jgi:hypothetical protein